MYLDYLKNSKDYKERFVAFYEFVLEKSSNVNSVLLQHEAKMLDFNLTKKTVKLMKKEKKLMCKILDTLEKRAKEENIDIQHILNNELHRQEGVKNA